MVNRHCVGVRCISEDMVKLTPCLVFDKCSEDMVKLKLCLVFDKCSEDMVKSTLCLVFDAELSKMGQRSN